MKQILISLLTICCIATGSTSLAQNLSVVNVTTMLDDNTAVASPRLDLNENLCALVRVVAPGVKGIEIKGRLGVVETLYQQGEYLVYVPEGTKAITYNHSDFHTGEVIFADYGLKKGLVGGKVYVVTLAAPEQKKTASVVLSLSPSDARVKLNRQDCPVKDGSTTVECAPGRYKFLISAQNYCSQELEVSIDNDLSMHYHRVNLQKLTTQFTAKCNVAEATIYIDGINYGTVGRKDIPVGRHNIRFSARGYEDYIVEHEFKDGRSETIDGQLKRCTRTVRILLDTSVKSIDYRPIKKNTTEVELKSRKHKFNGKTIRITPEMDGMSISQIMSNIAKKK